MPHNRKPQMSGWCANPSPESHARCHRQGAGNRANPAKEFQPCPCSCHLDAEEYECECGGTLRVAPLWPNVYEPDEPTYVHVNSAGRAIGEEC